MPPESDDPDDKAAPQPSFDPRTWIKAPPPPPAAPESPPSAAPPPGPTESSFDPRTWVRPQPSVSSPPPPKPPSRLLPAPRTSSRRGLVLAGAGVAALGAAGLTAWVLTRHGPAAQPVRLPVAAAPPPPPKRAPSGTSLLFDADSLMHLQILLSQYQISDTEAQAVRDALTDGFHGRDGKLHVTANLAAAHGQDDQIRTLTARKMDGSGVRLDREDGRLVPTTLASDLTQRLCATATGEMNATSFATSFARIMHDESLVSQFAAALAYDINFMHDLSPGCQFRGVYREIIDADGNLVGGRQLVFAFLDVKGIQDTEEFEGHQRVRQVAARTLKLYLFDVNGDGHPSWFDEHGASTVRGLMRTPVDGARVTSKFGLREHPIFEVVKFHEGVDFGCPIGTPAYAAGDGEVVIASPVRGYGNYLRIKHSEHMWTAYGHLSAYAPTTVVGAKVKQGQVVAFTGNTGNSTGPHLHFEIRIDGVAVDPLTFELQRTQALEGAQAAAFKRQRDLIDAVDAGCD